MSEIKFRIWNENSNEYEFNGIGISIMGEFMLMGEYNNLLNKAWKHDYWNDLVIEQYTGLKDKKGNEIYKGDIVKDGGLYPDIWVIGDSKEEYKKGKGNGYYTVSVNDFIYMVLYSEDHSGLNSTTQKDIEIIGNIHQNADLL